ncbi:MAG: cytochrome C oxidase subunit IV family protein [Ignavibacteria bacterium]|jgi:cytochrome c oxidase subunit 4|nr:cytochrome C oxidase subunit IV family protein [Ignavibacteria bacterium]MDH7528731.1 cytochrome C oxidase subunit IV family protein [Ignavibacteria bacterium]NPV10229.1 cytochrome-c oxidase [Ignavibacteria bacterium]
MDKKDSHNHIVGYGTYIFVWLTLIALTALTVTAASFDLGNFSIVVALVIASIKGLLVLLVFMHLRFDDRMFRIFVFVAFLTLTIFLVLTFSDYSFIR